MHDESVYPEPATFNPDTGAGSSVSTLSSAPSLTSSRSTSSTASSLFDEKELNLVGTPEDRFRSLTDLKWGEFELLGFGDVGADDKKLQFDLTEGARAVSGAQRPCYILHDSLLTVPPVPSVVVL